MTSAMYLEHYLDSLETLPVDLQRNFNLMRDLDTRSQNVLKEIDDLADEYLATVRKLSPDSRTDKIGVIQSLFTKSREYGDDKVQLAMQTYELVDKHIRRLDTDLARFEADLKDKIIGGTGTELKKKGTERKRKKGHKDEFDDEVPRKKKKKSMIQLPEVESPPPVIVPSISLAMAHQTEVLDMPVDPNEPTYCLCHQVSYGEMIGCDNVDCPIEWFHFACVGLTMKPKGKWYCPKCLVDRKKK